MIATTSTKTAIAIRHVHFEALGTFEPVLEQAGYALSYVDVARDDLACLDARKPDLLVALGGPVGVYETDTYPFLKDEIALLELRLNAGLPLLGICLGAQLIAAALGAKVRQGSFKEIGFSPLTLTDAGLRGPLRHLVKVPVFHWHGDAFDLPKGAELLAYTQAGNQAFSVGANVLGLQFHLEADTIHDLEAWLIGHAAELASAGIDPRSIRADAHEHGPTLRDVGCAVFTEWLAQFDARGSLLVSRASERS